MASLDVHGGSRYYRARYYHTDLQRFIGEDPIGLCSATAPRRLLSFEFQRRTPSRRGAYMNLHRRTSALSSAGGTDAE